MKFGRKLMALVTVFLMVFGGLPLTALADDTYPYVYQGNYSNLSTITDTSGTAHYTALIDLSYEPTSATVHAYCADEMHVLKNEHFKTENMGSGSVASHVRAIMYADYNSLVPGLSSEEKNQGVQAAIWHYTDSCTLDETSVDANAAALYEALIALGGKGPVDPTDPADVTVQTVGVAGYNSDGTINITFRFKASKDIDLTPAASAGTLGPVTDGGSGWSLVTVSSIPAGADFTLTVSGPQTIHYDAMYFVPESGSGVDPGQKLVGFPVASKITVSGTDTVQFGSLRLRKEFTAADDSDHGESFSATVTGGPGNSINITKTLKGDGSWVTVDGLPYGDYTVAENLTGSQQNRYNLQAITSGGTITLSSPSQDVTVTNCDLGSLTVKKVLSDGANTDFTFNIKGNGFDAGGKDFHLQGGGSQLFDKLEYGQYIITEVPTDGYLLTGMTGGTYDADAHTCTVTVGKDSRDVTVTATNKQYFRQVTFAKKVDDNSQDTTVFHLSIFRNGDTTACATADVSVGNPQTLSLPYGSYTVSEADTTDYDKLGFEPSNAFTVDADNYIQPITVTADNHRHTGIVEVIKTDKVSGAGIGGVEFTISRSQTDFTSADQVVAVLTTGSDGTKVSGPILVGNYWIKETATPSSYLNDNATAQPITIVAGDTVIGANTHTFSDTPNVGTLTIEKKDAYSHQGIEAVQFEIGTDANFSSLVTPLPNNGWTDANGMLVVSDLQPGSYWVREVTPKPGYELSGPATQGPITVNFNESTDPVVFSDCPQMKVKIIKMDASDHNIKLYNVGFGIFDNKDCTGTPIKLFTDSNGEVTSDWLPFGGSKPTSYWVKELSLPDALKDRYVIDGTPQQVIFTTPGDTKTFTFADDRNFGSLTVAKALDSDAGDATPFHFTISGPSYPVSDYPNGYGFDITGGHSKNFPELIFGTYIITEQATPGYELTGISGGNGTPSGSQITVDLNAGNQNFTVTASNRKLGSIKVSKAMQGTYSNAILPFAFTITSDKLAGPVTFNLDPSGAGSTYSLPNLEYGDYTITETSRADFSLIGFTGAPGTRNGNSYTVTVGSGASRDLQIVCTNQELGRLQVSKLEKGHPGNWLGGAVFQVTQVATGAQFTLTTSDVDDIDHGKVKGVATSDWILPGDYTVQEIQAPDGYHIDDNTPKTVTVNPGETDSTLFPFTDTVYEGSITVTKADAQDPDTKLSGVTFQCSRDPNFDSAKAPVYEQQTGSDGTTTFEHLTVGETYYVQETSAHAGYEITGSAQSVTVVFGEPNSLEFRDNELGTIQFQKKSADTGSPVDGVTFAISSQGGDAFGDHIIQTLTTDSTGFTPVSDPLVVGSYWVAEVNAPTGYDNDNASPWQVTVDFNTTITVGPCYDHQRYGSVTVAKDVDNVENDPTEFTVHIAGSGTADGISSDVLVNEAGVQKVTGTALDQLPYGDYTVTEVNVPDKYTAEGITITINGKTVDGNQFTIDDSTYTAAIAILATNELRLGSATFTKAVDNVDNDTTQFTLDINGDNGYSNTVTVGEMLPAASLTDLPLGHYTVTEESTTGYALKSITPSEFDVTADNYASTVTAVAVVNSKELGSATFTKAVDNVDKDTTEFTLDISGDNGYSNTVTVGEMLPAASLTDLPLGHYTVTEESTTGYALKSITPSEFDVTADNYASTVTAVAVVNSKELGSATFTKAVDNVDKDTTEFTLDISGDNGYSNTVTVGEMLPAASLTDLPLGHYTVTEESTTGYALKSITPSEFDVTADNYASTVTAVAVVNSKELGSATFTKAVDNVDKDTTEFTLDIKGDNGYSNTVTVGEMLPAASLTDLPLGHYTVTEESTTGYALKSITPSEFDVTADNYASTVTAVAVVNSKELGSATFTKAVDNVDKDTTEFTLDINGDNGYSNTVTVGEMLPAASLTDLPLGHYTVTEESTTGYALKSITPSGFDVTADNYASTVTAVAVVNSKELGSATFTKAVDNVDKDTTEFTLDISGDNGYSNTVTVGEMLPAASLTDLPLGHYTVTEESTTGYALKSITPSEFDVTADNYASTVMAVAVVNSKELGSATFTKAVDNVDKDTTEFTLDINGDNGYSNKVTVGEMLPAASLTDLPLGHYTVTEESTTGYSLKSITPSEFDVTADNYASTVTAVAVVNSKELGSATFTKAVDNVDKDTTEFTLDVTGDNGYSNKVTVGEMLPAASLTDLPLGHYTVTEESTTGYSLKSITPSEFDVTADNYASTVTAVAVVNSKELGSATFTKAVDNVDKDTTEFTLDINGDNGYSNTVTVGEMLPAASLTDLPLGHYTVTEESTTGYALKSITPSGFDVTADNYASTVTAVAVVNHKSPGTALVKKLSYYDNLPIKNVYFQLLSAQPSSSDDNSGVIDTQKTDSNGIAVFNGLVVGQHYWVREIQQADNYDIDKQLVKEVVAALDPDPADAPVFQDHPLGYVNLIKYDASTVNNDSDNPYADATAVGGAVYGVYDNAACSGTPITTITTSASGAVKSDALPFGSDKPATYYVQEMAPAPAGFVLSDEIQSVTFKYPGQIADLQFEDSLLARLQVVKVDALNPNTTLDGASFKLYDNADLADAHQVDVEKTTGVGGNKGFVEFDNLTPGKDYWILETKAPTDYKLPDPNVAYKVTVPSGLTVFTVQDEYNPPHPYPPTATNDWNFLLIGGLALLGGALLIIVSRKRKPARVRTTHIR